VGFSQSRSTPTVSLSHTSLSFGSQPVATTSTAQTITLSNGGSAGLSITSRMIAGANGGDFAGITDTGGNSVGGGGNCMIRVTFTPSAVGAAHRYTQDHKQYER